MVLWVKDEVWAKAPFCLFYIIWKQRNRRTFEGVEPLQLIMENIVLKMLCLLACDLGEDDDNFC